MDDIGVLSTHPLAGLRYMNEKDKRSPWLENYAAKMPDELRAYFLEFVPRWLETHLDGLQQAEREEFLRKYEEASTLCVGAQDLQRRFTLD
jgi:hypothetical protein